MERSHAPLSTWFWAAYPFNAFRSLLGIAGGAAAPTFDGLYSGEWNHPTFSGCGKQPDRHGTVERIARERHTLRYSWRHFAAHPVCRCPVHDVCYAGSS